MQPRTERPAGRTQSPEHGSPGPAPEAPPPPPPPQPPAPEAERARPRQARPTAPMEGTMQLLSREGHAVSHNSKRHYHDAFVAMSRMRQRGLLCDIVLHVAAKEIRAHKVVLASCSPYFHAMFTNEMSESRQTHVTLHDIDPQALDQLVQFAYTAEIVVGEGNVQVWRPQPHGPCCHGAGASTHPMPPASVVWPLPQSSHLFLCPCSPGPLSHLASQTLLPAASLLQLNGVRDACCKFLLSQLDPSNCLGIRGFADTHSCGDLLKAAHRYVLQHFVDVAKTEEFMLLPLKQVLELVSSDSLNVPSEEDVYRAVLSWVKHDVDARRQHVPRLMKCVRLPLLSRDFLLGHVDAESLVRHHPDCKDLLIEALKFHLLPEQRGVLGTSRTRPRRCEGAGPVLFAVGGGSLFAIHGDCEAYDTRTDRWHVVASMSTRRARVGVAAVGNRLYAVGGYDGTSDLATVESYDPVTNTWQPEVSMGTRRSCLGVAALHGLLYAAGGYDGASCLNSAERYDPLTGTWTSIAAMSTRRRYVRVAMLDGNLYAVGGYDSSSHLATVEKYEPQVNSWTPVASMLSRRSSAGVAVLEGALYVAGGNDGTSCLNSVERYSPKAGAWESVAPMNIRRSTHDLVAMDGWLYAVGGNDGSSSLNSIEKYNPRTNKVLSRVTRGAWGGCVPQPRLRVGIWELWDSAVTSRGRAVLAQVLPRLCMACPLTSPVPGQLPLPPMGNSHCIPQAPRRLRASFSRKPSLKGNREDGARKLAGLFGTEAGADGDTTADKIFHYIPGTNIPGLQSQQEILEQPFLSVFKEGRRRAAVRSLGSVVHYAKVQLRFQHSQNVSDCYLELFSSHLYFQAHGPEGLTFQGLLPLMELSVCPLEGSREHAFQITGPLPAPLLVLCPSQAELGRWLYHLEKQIALVGGVPRCPPEPLQGPTEDALPWTLQHRLTRLRTASGRQVMGSAICASRVKLQHLPSQEQWDRLLVLYPTSLAIFSEEADGLCFKGELPLSAIHINLEEKEKQIRSFLIEGPLTASVHQAVSSIPSVWCAPATRTIATGCSACKQSAVRTGPPHHPALRASRGCGRPHRLWSVAEARSPLMHGPAGTQGARRPPPLAPATPSLSPQHHPLQAAQPGPHQSLVPTGASQPWLHQRRWAQGKAETGRQQPITQEQGPG
ncbi:kelch-like protein 17 isoform X8 [Ovis aries]|uniref:kelch-like protein 17 isoform X8 n=1 Tax=Ovis aries TaxID=9940 RepID=UPI0029525FD1|nr:kelch-like protein 17 isoform X8 [Ovis aries]